MFRFDFFSVDDDHVMSVARGPLRDAIHSFQQVAGKTQSLFASMCIYNILTYIHIKESAVIYDPYAFALILLLEQAAWPGSSPVLNHEELYRQGRFNGAKNGHSSEALGDRINGGGSSSSSNSSIAEVDSGGGSSVCMYDGGKSSKEDDVELWAELFGEHFRGDRLPPLVKMSLQQLLHLVDPVK